MAAELVRRGALNGLFSEFAESGVPKYVWSVDADHEVYTAKIDGDSTGSMTGNLLGALWGIEAIPKPWLHGLELRADIDRLAVDLDAVNSGRLSAEDAWDAYPGW